MDNLKRQFAHYVIPSTLSFVLAGVYCFTDAFFVGNRVGDLGIAAINIAFSILALMQAFGTGIGLGGSIRYTIKKARGNLSGAQNSLSVSYFLLTLSSLIIALPLFVFSSRIMILLGASPAIAELGSVYMKILAVGTIFQVWGTALTPITRNCGGSVVAMVSMISGLVANIVLDWLFVWVLDLGMSGAAYATVLAQFASLAISLVFLIKTKNLKFAFDWCSFKETAKEILAVAISPFGLTFVPNISVIILNKSALFYGGEQAVAAYGCIAYLVYIVYLVFQGVDDGAQPLISLYYGKKDVYSTRKLKNMTMFCALVLSVFTFATCFLMRKTFGLFMGTSSDVNDIISNGLVIFILGLPCVAVSRTVAGNLYATESNRRSYIISYSEPFFMLIFALILPKFFGLDGVWLSNTAAQVCVMILSLFSLS